MDGRRTAKYTGVAREKLETVSTTPQPLRKRARWLSLPRLGHIATKSSVKKNVPRGMWGSHMSRADVSRDSPRDRLQKGKVKNFPLVLPVLLADSAGCQGSVPVGMWEPHRPRMDLSRDRWIQSAGRQPLHCSSRCKKEGTQAPSSERGDAKKCVQNRWRKESNTLRQKRSKSARRKKKIHSTTASAPCRQRRLQEGTRPEQKKKAAAEVCQGPVPAGMWGAELSRDRWVQSPKC